MIVMTVETNPLVTFLNAVLTDRRLSQRALALYAGVASSTISRIMSGGEPDPDTLIKIAAYLDEPVQRLFRLAGWLPEVDVATEMLEEIEYLMRDLPEESQRRLRDQARLERKYNEEDNKHPDQPEQVRKAS